VVSADFNIIRGQKYCVSTVVWDASGGGFQASYWDEGTDFKANFKTVGFKVSEQLVDDFLNLFVWS
jgi:hypothetical protein